MDRKAADEPRMGYNFYPKRYAHAPGHPRLEVTINEHATGLHFDPELVRLRVRARGFMAEKGPLETLVLRYPIPQESEHDLCAGRVVIEDRKGKKVEAFTFGGKLQVRSLDSSAICIIESSAPIIDLINENPAGMMLAEEVEIVLSERRAASLPDLRRYQERLVSASPQELYAALLEAIRARHDHPHHEGTEIEQDLLDFVAGEIRALRAMGEWPSLLPRLEDLT